MKPKISRVITNPGKYYYSFTPYDIFCDKLNYTNSSFFLNIYDFNVPCIIIGTNGQDLVLVPEFGPNDSWYKNHMQKLYNLSQDEIDQLIKDLNDQFAQAGGYSGPQPQVSYPSSNPPHSIQYIPGSEIVNGSSTSGTISVPNTLKDDQLDFNIKIDDDWTSYSPHKKSCDHVWVDYLGLNESFKFCKKCDVKK